MNTFLLQYISMLYQNNQHMMQLYHTAYLQQLWMYNTYWDSRQKVTSCNFVQILSAGSLTRHPFCVSSSGVTSQVVALELFRLRSFERLKWSSLQHMFKLFWKSKCQARMLILLTAWNRLVTYNHQKNEVKSVYQLVSLFFRYSAGKYTVNVIFLHLC